MNTTVKRLKGLCKQHPKFLGKGGLCVALVVTKTATDKGLPLKPESLRTAERGQVAGLGRTAVQRILEEHGIRKILAEEGGRTSRGTLGLMEAYVGALNDLHAAGDLDLDEAAHWWIGQVREHFAKEGPRLRFDSGKSLKANIKDLLSQAEESQRTSGGMNYVGAMLQHLVGAKLDLVLGKGIIRHCGFSVADHPRKRSGDFEIDTAVIHVTTHPTEALVRRCKDNLGAGLKPIIITAGDSVNLAILLLRGSSLEERVDVLDAIQFLTANVYERSLFQAAACKVTLTNIIQRYNDIVSDCESDPGLQISLAHPTKR